MMFAQVRIDCINKEAKSSLYLGVTRIPPAQLNLPGLCYDLKESVILWDTDVRVNGDKVSFHSYSCECIFFFGVTECVKKKKQSI